MNKKPKTVEKQPNIVSHLIIFYISQTLISPARKKTIKAHACLATNLIVVPKNLKGAPARLSTRAGHALTAFPRILLSAFSICLTIF